MKFKSAAELYEYVEKEAKKRANRVLAVKGESVSYANESFENNY